MSASIVISIVALAVSVVSITWQTWSWLRSGPVIRVSTSNSIPTYGDQLGAQHLTVTAENRGRAAATIEGWGLLLPNDGKIIAIGDPLLGAPSLPHRLDSHSSASWYMLFADVARHCEERGVAPSDVQAFVRVSGQGLRTGRKGLPMAR
ncbi:hypothetical protein ACFQ7N_01720 [Streptomyces niveus]|uniref:hypothetical protein n=1 Tax=Streptomyces niveus TaxID=193462 RepID=UPI0036BEE039